MEENLRNKQIKIKYFITTIGTIGLVPIYNRLNIQSPNIKII